MDLILWRHADAAEGGRDLDRKLTAKGHKQAARVAEWLIAQLPSKYTVLSSPARRARETAARFDCDIALVGILPTLSKSNLGLESMVPTTRYHALNDAICALRMLPSMSATKPPIDTPTVWTRSKSTPYRTSRQKSSSISRAW